MKKSKWFPILSASALALSLYSPAASAAPVEELPSLGAWDEDRYGERIDIDQELNQLTNDESFQKEAEQRIKDQAAAFEKAIAEEMNQPVMVKAQVHVGGRGKAGGVKLARSLDEVRSEAERMLGMTISTYQTGGRALPVDSVLIAEATDIETELYLALLVDRGTSRISFVCSTEGGMDIEEVAETNPEKILKAQIDPAFGLGGFQAATAEKHALQFPVENADLERGYRHTLVPVEVRRYGVAGTLQ